MDKKIYKAVMERANNRCEICGSSTSISLHHLIHGSGKRKQCETIESCKALCIDCHNKIHGKHGHALDIRLKIDLQAKYFSMGYTESEVREKMGSKLYFEEGDT